MEGRRQHGQKANESKHLIHTALIAALIDIGAQQNVAEGFANQYMECNGIPSQVVFQSYLEDMVDKYILSLESAVRPSPQSKPPVVQIFDCGDDGVLRAVIMKMRPDGNCFLHSMIAFRKDCLSEGIECPEFSLDSTKLRRQVVDFMESNLDHPTMCSGISVRKYFDQNYGPSVPPSSRIQVRRSGESSPERARFYVNDVMSFLAIMSQPGTHVDEAFITAFSIMYRLRVQVITQARSELRPLEFTDDPKLEAFVALGVSLKEARELLIKYKDDVSRAMDEVLSRREPEPIVDSSKIRWQIQPYGDLTKTKIGLVCSSGHYDLMMPPPGSDCDLLEASGYLPPRIKPSKCGVAAVPEQPTHQTSILSTKEMWVKYQQSQGCGGGSAAVPAPAAQPFRNFSAGGGGAAAVPEQPAQSFRKPSAGGGAAAVLHQQHISFGHSQPQFHPRKPAYAPSRIIEFDGSGISDLISQFALYNAVIRLAKLSGSSTSSFKVTNLTLVKDALETACKDGVKVFGSFITSEHGSPEIRFRAVGFQFEDNSVVNHEKLVASLSDPDEKKAFASRVNRKWQLFMITAITFERCN